MDRLDDVRRRIQAARRITVLTGAGVSAASGVPTFRGAGGLWKNRQAQQLATPEAVRYHGSIWRLRCTAADGRLAADDTEYADKAGSLAADHTEYADKTGRLAADHTEYADKTGSSAADHTEYADKAGSLAADHTEYADKAGS